MDGFTKEEKLRVLYGIACALALMCAVHMLSLVSKAISTNEDKELTVNFSKIYFPSVAMFLSVSFARFVQAMNLDKNEKDDKTSMIKHFVYAGIYMVCGLIVLCGTNALSSLKHALLLYYLSIIAGRVFAIVQAKKKIKLARPIINIVFISIITLILLSTKDIYSVIFLVLAAFFITLQYMGRIIYLSFSRIRIDVLKKIVRKTYAAEILFGLLLLIIGVATVLANTEPGIDSFSDALWYCFAIVTTIGFGDFTAVTLTGRVLSVILGIYGIIVVSLITSIIVNFYSEIKNDRDDEDHESGNAGKESDAVIEETVSETKKEEEKSISEQEN